MARPKKFSRPGVPVPARPAKDSNAKASSSKTGSDGPDRRKRGFQVGPAHAPRNAYLGKVKKIKDDLIVKAKLKKQYAKVLKETGGTSERLRDRNAPRGEKPATGEEGGDGDVTREDDEAGPSDRASAPRGKGSKPGKLDRKPSKDLRATGETTSASIKGDRRQPGLKRKRSDAEGATEPRPTDATSTTAQPHKVRALSPSDISAPMPQTSFRELKKEAFRKYHPARQHSSAAAPQTHAGRRTVSGASHASHVSGPPGAGKAMRGQPNMAARMGVLLEKIKRDKTA